jgi:hypothetical protein
MIFKATTGGSSYRLGRATGDALEGSLLVLGYLQLLQPLHGRPG